MLVALLTYVPFRKEEVVVVKIAVVGVYSPGSTIAKDNTSN